jgi:hypothetical protein
MAGFHDADGHVTGAGPVQRGAQARAAGNLDDKLLNKTIDAIIIVDPITFIKQMEE